MPQQAQQTNTIDIEALPEKCYKAICDFESYPEWQSNVKEVRVLTRWEDGRPRVVEYIASVLSRKVRYVLEYAYKDKNHTLTWTYVEGDIKDTFGSYAFKKKGAKKTLATYSLFVDLGFWVPQLIVATLNRIGMVESMQALKDRVEGGSGGEK